MNRILSTAAFFACMGLSSAVYAQTPQQNAPPPEQKEQSDSAKVSVTGCLVKGTGATGYLITDQKSGEKVPFDGPAQLDKYVNQTVKLTGRMVAQGGDKVFKPEAISQVASSCEKAQ